MCPPLTPFYFLRVSGGYPRTGSRRYGSPENSPSCTGVHTHYAPRSRYKAARTAPPSSFQTARVTAQIEGNAAVPLRFPGRTGSHRQPPLPLAFLPCPLPAQVSPVWTVHFIHRAAPGSPGSQDCRGGGEGPGEEHNEPETCLPVHMARPGLFSGAFQPSLRTRVTELKRVTPPVTSRTWATLVVWLFGKKFQS